VLFLSKRTHPSTFPISPEKSTHAGVFTMAVGAHGGQLSTHIVWTFRQKKTLGMRRDVLISQRHVCVCIRYAVAHTDCLDREKFASPLDLVAATTKERRHTECRMSVRPSVRVRLSRVAAAKTRTLILKHWWHKKKDKRDTANVTRLT